TYFINLTIFTLRPVLASLNDSPLSSASATGIRHVLPRKLTTSCPLEPSFWGSGGWRNSLSNSPGHFPSTSTRLGPCSATWPDSPKCSMSGESHWGGIFPIWGENNWTLTAGKSLLLSFPWASLYLSRRTWG